MGIKLLDYKKKFDYSYAIGVYPTLELMNYKPKEIIKILLATNSKENGGARKIADWAKRLQIPIEIEDRAINRLSGKENTYAIGVFRKYEADLDQAENHVVLDGIRDMGNLGTIVRTMLAFDLHDLAVIKPAADIFDPKVVRASMGAVFQINFSYFDTFEMYKKHYNRNYYSFMTNGKASLDDVSFKAPYTLIFGSESEGLPEIFQRQTTSVKIDFSKKVDSLNLAICVGIALQKTYSEK